MDAPMDFLPILSACLVILAGSIMQSATGMGAGLMMAPVLVLIDPVFVPGPILLSSMSLNMLILRREGVELRRDGLMVLLVGLVVGSVLGALAIRAIEGPPAALLFGGLILLAVAISAMGIRIPETRPVYFLAGVLGAFMGVIAAVGATVLALLYQHHPGPVIRPTLAFLYLVSCVIMVGFLLLAGKFGWAELYASIVLLPGWLLGYRIARQLARYLDAGATRVAILVIAGGSAVFLIVRNATALQFH